MGQEKFFVVQEDEVVTGPFLTIAEAKKAAGDYDLTYQPVYITKIVCQSADPQPSSIVWED